jgi:mannan endo-1,4-beta-mannosidase
MHIKKILPVLTIILLSSNIFAQESVFNNFITALNGKLMDGDSVYRFISFNIPNLNYVEDEFGFNYKYPYRMPDTFEMTDAFESIKQLGGKVIRMYTIPVRNRNEGPYPTYVLAPGEFDEESFKTMDTMLVLANKIGVRIIIPLINNWRWMGGRPQYAEFRGKSDNEFWSDSVLIEDVKKTIDHVVNRRNTINGVLYKDDKAILCWETGNELYSTPIWTATICRFIKGLDQNHLIMDGFDAINNRPVQEESYFEPSVDILTTHHYENDPEQFIEDVAQHIKDINGRKPYIIGEFGFFSTPAIEKALNYIIQSDVSGALIWSLRYHRKEGGFYWHTEPHGNDIYKAYHWPGFESGLEYDETNLLSLMQKKGFEIQGKTVPEIKPPEPPVLLSITDESQISWQGSTGASSYDLERSNSLEGPWEIVGYDLSDANEQYFPLFNDSKVKIGNEYFYRVTAKNAGGRSLPSNIVGPVKVTHKCLIDNAINYQTIFSKQGNINIAIDRDRVFREKMSRLLGDTTSSLTYVVNGNLEFCKVFAFSETDESSIEFFISSENKDYKKVEFIRESLNTGKGYYGFWVPAVYSVTNLTDENVNFIKLIFTQKTQVSRVEIYYK